MKNYLKMIVDISSMLTGYWMKQTKCIALFFKQL